MGLADSLGTAIIPNYIAASTLFFIPYLPGLGQLKYNCLNGYTRTASGISGETA